MLPVPDKKKKSVNDDVPIFGASSSPSSSTPVIGTAEKGGDSDLPIFGGVGTNKKKDGSENYGTGSPSESVSDVESTEQIAPKSFIENDIENSQYSRDNAKQFTFESIGQPSPMVAPIGADVMIAKEKEKKNILSNSSELSKYSKSRIDALTGDIQNLKKRLSAHTLPSSTQMGIPSLTPTQFYTDGGDSIKDEIAAKQKYLQQFKDNLLKLASHQVVKERNIPNPSQQDIESIGADVLQVTHDAGIGDDLEVLRTIGEVAAPRKVPSNVSLGVPTPSPTNYTASAIPKSDIDLTTQNIKYKFYKTGAEALQQYYINQAEEFGDKAKDNIAALNEINQKLSKPLPANDRDALVDAQQAIMQDSDVKEYLNSIDNAIVYSKKSKDAVDNFPQVKRQQMQQTLNDVYFNMLLAKDAATSAIPNNLGLRVANWLFGDTAGEEDVKSLSKATGISEDQVRDIINQRAQGWFSGSDKSGVRVPGFLPAIAQGMDETMGNAAMGIDRFLGAKNAEASNRILSDKLQSYNLRAQKAKLYDDAGKLNFNPYSLMNEMGRGIGQTAIYAAPSMVGGGLATGVAEGLGATVKNAENVGKVISGLLTVDSGFAASYEDAYKEAARYTNDESVRRAYAFKVGLANGLSETILEPAAVAKKVGLGKNTTKETFNTFLKNYKEGGAGKAVWEGLKEAGGVIRDENIEEILVNIAQNKAKESDLGVDTSPSEFMDQSIQTIISTTLTTLPLGIGAGMNGARDQSGIRRNALFEAGNNPELYTGELKKKLDNGSLNQDQYNERVSVVNTMAAIVKNIKPTDIHGNKLSYDQKSKLAAQQFRILNNNRILESGATVEAEKPIIEADNKEAIKNQSDILNATPTESSTEESVQEFDEGVPQSSKDALIEKIQAIDSRNAMVKQAQQNPEEGIAFIQDQATGMTSDRSSAAQPTYDETVKMFGEDVVNHAVSILPQDTKDMILKNWKEKGIEAPSGLMNALQSTAGEMQEQKKSEVATEEKEEESPKVTIAEVIDKPVTYNGKRAIIVQDGQTLVAKIKGENVEYELGNIDEVKGEDISDYGIESEQSVVSTNDDGDIVVRGNAYKNNYSNPLAAINYDKDGNVQSVTLDTENGQKRTFRGDIAEDIAYQIQLKEISKDNESRQQFEDFVEQDDETKQQIVSGYDEAVAAQGAEGDNEKVPGEPNKGAGTQQSEPESKPVERKKAEKRQSPTKKESSLTKDAEDLLSSLGDGSAPAFVSKNLERIAKENGIEVTDKTTANDIVNQLREKQKSEEKSAKKQEPASKSAVNSGGQPTKSPSTADELESGTTKKSSPKNKITTIEEAEEELKRLFALDSLTKDNEEGEVSLINKNGKINYEQLERTSEGIESGKIIFERFSPKEQRGLTDGGRANVEASVILATKSSSDKSFANSNEAQENAIEEYAKNKSIWYDNPTEQITDKYGEPIGAGEEAIVWDDGAYVVKSQNDLMYGTLQEKLDGITLQNSLFPEAAVEVIGFGRNVDGDFQVIVRQPFIKAADIKVTAQEIRVALNEIGFTEDENGNYSNGDTIIEDVHTGNAVKTPSGNIVIIDPITRLNSTELGYGGHRIIKNNISNNIASDKISSIKVGDKSNTIQLYLDKAKSVLQQLYPGATITTYDTAEEYYDKEKRPVGSAGVFHPKEQRLALNLELISKHGIENTVFHEVIHPIVNEAIVSREGALDSAWARLMELKDVQGMEAVFEHVQAYAGRGANIQKVEGVTEFLTQVADGRIDISKMPEKTSSKIIDLINKIFEALGISKRIGTPTDLKRLADSIKSSFESADASAIKDVIGRRGENNTASSFDALNQKEQEDAIKDIIARSENIDEEKLKDLIKKYTGWDDEKVNSFFAKKEDQDIRTKEKDSREGDRSILNRLYSSEKLSDETKDRIKEKGLKYEPKSQTEARAIATEIISDNGIEDAVYLAESGKFSGDVNSMIFAVSLDDLYSQEQSSATPSEKMDLAQKYADIALRYQDAAENGGRFISAIYDFYKKSPAGLVLKTEKEFQRKRDLYFKGREEDLQSAFDEFINTVEGKEIFEAAANKISSSKKKTVFSKDSEKRVRNFFDNLKINTKGTANSYLLPPQIFNAAIDIIKESVVAGISIGRAIEKGIDYISDNYTGTWDVNEFKKDIRSGFKKQNIKHELTDEDRAKILKKWDKRLRGLDQDSKNRLLNKAFIELMDNGALELDRFKKMYAEAIGLPIMTPELSKRLSDIANAINKPESLKDDLEKNPTPQKVENYKKSLKDAETASKELNELIGKERWWVDTLTTVMRLNTLGVVSLVGNIVYNVAALPVRFSTNITSTGLDYILSGVQIASDKMFGSSFYNNNKISNPFKIQAAWFRGFRYGTSKSVQQLISGVSNMDYFQKEIQQNIRPFSAGKNLWKAMTGKQKMSANAIANAFIESFPTGGMSANIIARMLNVGDKPFRFASEFAKAEELANRKGLRGINKEVFMLFPDEESADVIQKHGEEITFQQKNIVTKAVDAIGNSLSHAVKDRGFEAKAALGAAKIFGYTVQPFLNTPLNVFNEFIHYAFPPLSIYQATKSAIKGDSSSANRYISKAIVGWSIQAAATQLLLTGLLIAGGDDDDSQKERKGIQTYHRQGQLNFTGLKRLLSGGNANPMEGDIYIDIKYWGFLGMIMLAKASQYKKATKEQIHAENFAMDMIGMFPSAVQTGLTEGVFSGTSSLLNAYSMGGGYVDNWLLGMANTAQNFVAPQWLRSFSLASDPYMRDTKGVSLSESAFNQIKQRYFSGESLPIKRNIWGDKISSTPKDQNSYVYYLFGINKKNELNKSAFGYGIYDLYDRTKDQNVFPSVLKRQINGHDLTPDQYEQLQELVGSHRKQLVGAFMSSTDLSKVNNNKMSEVTKKLQKIYTIGRSIGVSEFLSLHPDLQVKNKK